MTTIAWRGLTMAADTQLNHQGIKNHGTKIHRTDNAIIGVAGDYMAAMVFVDWYENRESRRPDLGHEDGFEALVLTAEGVEYWTANLRPTPITSDYYAIGSGSHLALGAMFMGATPAQAVEVAANFDLHTGGSITTAEIVLPKAQKNGPSKRKRA